MRKKMEAAWQSVWARFFCEKTNLIYDRLGSRGDAFSELPNPEEIALQYPNPCGWGTGMEDCCLNAGHVMETLVLRRAVLGEDIREKAEKMVDGVYRCATVHGKPGFLVRGITPSDGKGCYPETSRDQITMAVYGLWRLLSVPELSEETRGKMKFTLNAISAYCEKTVTPENDYNYLTLDGRRGMVCKMWNCGIHEMLRLPMIHAAAYCSTGDRERLNLANSYMAEGMRVSEQIDPAADWWDFPLVQMQISLRFLLECGRFPEYGARLKNLMEKVAGIACSKFELLLSEAEKYRGSWHSLNRNWRECPAKLQYGTLSPDGRNAVWNGRVYPNPVYAEDYFQEMSLLRGLGNYYSTMAHAHGFRIPDRLTGRFVHFLTPVELEQCTGSMPVNLLNAYWLTQHERGRLK